MSPVFNTDRAAATERPDNGAYWCELLAPFQHGEQALPRLQTASATAPTSVSAKARVKVPLPVPFDVLALAGFELAITRYSGGVATVIASPIADGSADCVFFRCIVDERVSGAAFLEKISAEMQQTRRCTPASLADLSVQLTSAFGLDPSQQRAAFFQFGFASIDVSLSDPLAELMLEVRAADTAIEVQLHFDSARYSTSFITQFTQSVTHAIEWLATAGNAKLVDADLLSEAERRRIVVDFNSTLKTVPDGITLHGLVTDQAARTPAARAVVYRDRELTYDALDAQSDHLADVLVREHGVATGSIVGVMLGRSERTIVSLLAVLKTGAAYVPIDPRHPWETVNYMVSNAGISVLVVDAESIAGAAMFAGRLVVIDFELRAPITKSAVPLAAVDARQLAYVIYTSGSSGRPKGVAVDHRAAANTILWRNEYYAIVASDVNLQMPSFAFDSSVVDIFCTLSTGGCLVIPEEGLRLDAHHLKDLCIRHRVTSCLVTPSYYKLLVRELAEADSTLRYVTLAGEATTPDLIAMHFAHLPNVALFNEYGPTENAVCSTACKLDAVTRTVSIGAPIANVRVLVLDSHRRLCPIGVSGEIFLAGVGLACGYLNQPALTAERFVPHQLTEQAEVLYRTGDRGCWRDDGSLDFFGRLDNQVKVRGFRIELDEIELALLQHPSVLAVAVLCKSDVGGTPYVAAYVETREAVDRAELRAHLVGRIAYYMVPDIVAVLETLPLNQNGKIDRNVLRSIDDFASTSLSPVATLSELESTLLSLSAAVLKRATMTLDDNFFDLGGNSLRVMELTSRIRSEMALPIELLDIYTFPTIRELANRLARAQRGELSCTT